MCVFNIFLGSGFLESKFDIGDIGLIVEEDGSRDDNL